MRNKILPLMAAITLISQFSQPAFADPLYNKGFYAGVLYERNRLSQQYYAMEDENARLQSIIAELKQALEAQEVQTEQGQNVAQFIPKDVDDSR
jgi:hypothetical protein